MAAVGTATRRRTHKTRTPGLYRVDPSRIFRDGAWEVRYRDGYNGTRRKTFKTRQEALAFQASVRTDKNRGDFIDPRIARTPFHVVAERWYGTTAKRRDKTRAGYRYILDNHLLPRLGDYRIDRITSSVLRTFLAELPDHLSPTTQRNIFRTLSPIFRIAVDDGMIRTNPLSAKSVRDAVPAPAQHEMKFLDAAQVDALAREIGSPYDTLIYFASYTGMRAGEIAALRVKSLDRMRGRVRVIESVSEVSKKIAKDGRDTNLVTGPPKNGRAREVGLPPFLRDRLAEYVAGKEREDFVFTGAQGGQLRHGNFYRRHFKPAVRRAVPDDLHSLRFHDLRHTAASLLIANNVHAKAVSEWLGHSSIAITMDRYGHLYRDHQDAIVAQLQETFESAASMPVDEAEVRNLAAG